MASPRTAPVAVGCALHYLHPEVEGQKYVVYFDHERHWLRVSPAVIELLRCSPAELIGQTVDSFLPPEIGHNEEMFEEFLSTGDQTSIMALVARDGSLHGVRVHSKKLDDGCMVSWWEKI